MDALREYLDGMIRLDEDEFRAFTARFSEIGLQKNEHFAKAGEFPTRLGFLLQGVMRAYFRDPSGHEYNKTFFTPPGFVAAYSSLTTKQENLIGIQCLTDCRLLWADFAQITSLYGTYPKIESLARKLAERKFALKEKREIELVILDARARYDIFKREHPQLENQIKQYHIASYLGISPTQLSRIRSKP